MSYLLDTNVLSELRKGARANPGVRGWVAGVAEDELFVSVLVLGEIRTGIENIRRRDQQSAVALDAWLREVIEDHRERILGVDAEIADVWGGFNVPDPLPTIDCLLAATAHIHGLTVVTRNVKDLARTGVSCLDPFEEPAG